MPDVKSRYITSGNAKLFCRETGSGQPLIILHGGPDFDHNYLLPDMDNLSASFHLIYYDQRGRGKSSNQTDPEDVSIKSEIKDLDNIRKFFGFDSVALLGHSWGGLLALEYAIRHSEHVSHLIIMNSAPVSHGTFKLFKEERNKKNSGDIKELMNIASGQLYNEGDINTDLAYHRIHFRSALKNPKHIDKLLSSLRLNFTNERILKAREIEDKLLKETQLSPEYNLFPALRKLSVPALIIHGDHDFIPAACAENIARAIPGAKYVLLTDCGHFAYLEQTTETLKVIRDFFSRSR